MAFSTSVCNIIDGNTADFKPSGTLTTGCRRPSIRTCHDFQKGAAEIDLLTQRGPAAVAHLRHGRAQVADEALLHPGCARRVGLDELVDAGQRIEEEMRLDLRLQRLHARFQHGALELFGFGALGGLVGGQLRSALAARHHLDDEGGDDEQEDRVGVLEYAGHDQAQE